MNRVFFVPSKMCPLGRMKKKAVPTGKSKKLFGIFTIAETVVEEEFVQTGESDCQVDSLALALDVETKINVLEANGFVILNVNPVISGAYAYKSEWSARFSAGYGFGYGYSFTAGMMLIARKIESSASHLKSPS